MPDWVGEWVDRLVGLFGPVGAFAIILLGISLWVIYKLFHWGDDKQRRLTALVRETSEALAKKEAECIAEKAEYRAEMQRQLDEHINRFMIADNNKRLDVIKCFEKLDGFVDRITIVLEGVRNALVAVQIEVAKK